ncbi:MAG TPA: hypothetical protein VHZ03_20940 [Trebonia sp.]|jgi:hypothetical protein|nr:hypothetical protein [Trebonia sp.]
MSVISARLPEPVSLAGRAAPGAARLARWHPVGLISWNDVSVRQPFGHMANMVEIGDRGVNPAVLPDELLRIRCALPETMF